MRKPNTIDRDFLRIGTRPRAAALGRLPTTARSGHFGIYFSWVTWVHNGHNTGQFEARWKIGPRDCDCYICLIA